MRFISSLLMLAVLSIYAPCVVGSSSEDLEAGSVHKSRGKEKRARADAGTHDAPSSEKKLAAYVFTERGDSLKKRARTICSDPTVVCIDFSSAELKDSDLESVFKGLVDREEKLETGDGYPINFINISSPEITEAGLLNFLANIQNGRMRHSKIVYPDVRKTTIKIGFSLTEEFLESLQKSSPSVFAGVFRIVD